jgi:hypothetical protein
MFAISILAMTELQSVVSIVESMAKVAVVDSGEVGRSAVYSRQINLVAFQNWLKMENKSYWIQIHPYYIHHKKRNLPLVHMNNV